MAEVILRPKKIRRILFVLIAVFTVAHFVGGLSFVYFGTHAGFGIFDLNEEETVPTLFQSSLWLVASGLTAIIAYLKKKGNEKFALHWKGLAVLFLFLAIDETVTLHERLGEFFHKMLHTSGFLYYAWIIPYGVLLIGFGAAYARFVFHLPQRSRILLALAGVIYVGGALGMESFEGYYFTLHGQNNPMGVVLVAIEEVCEMIGVVLCQFALMTYLSTEYNGVQITVSSPPAS